MNTQTTTFVNDAMDGDTMMPRSRIGVDRVLKSLRNFATLSEALRILGAGVLLASMSVFLLQGWSEGNDIRRYLLLAVLRSRTRIGTGELHDPGRLAVLGVPVGRRSHDLPGLCRLAYR